MNEEDHKSQTDNISESMKEKLKEEGKEFYSLAKSYRSERFMRDDKSVNQNLNRLIY